MSCYTLLVLCLVSYRPSAITLASASGFLTQQKVSFWNSLTLTRVQASHHVVFAIKIFMACYECTLTKQTVVYLFAEGLYLFADGLYPFADGLYSK